MKNINDFIKENIDEVMRQEMDAAEEQYNKKMSHSSELEENYKANLSEQYENDRKSIEDQIKELQNKLNKLDEQKELLQQPLEEKLNDYQKRKEKRETGYQEEYKELLAKANDDANQKEFLLRQKNEEFEKFKDTTKMILKDWGIELVETNTDTKTKFSIVTPDTREIGFSFDYNNPEKPFFFIQDGNDKTEPVREECSAIEAAYILKEVALETSRQLKWFKNKDNEYSLDLTRVAENAFKEAKDVNYEFDIPRLGKQQEELLEFYNDYFRTQRGDIEQTAEVLSQLEEVNDALTKDEQNTKKKIQEDNEKLEELKRQQEEAQTEEEKELIRKEIEELTNNQKERHSFLENLKETKDDFKDKISTFWIHTVNGVQANIAKAQLTIREAQENIKNWFEQRDKDDYLKAGGLLVLAGLTATSIYFGLKKDNDEKKINTVTPYGYTMECDDGRTVTGRSEMEAKAMCAYKNEDEQKTSVRATLTKSDNYIEQAQINDADGTLKRNIGEDIERNMVIDNYKKTAETNEHVVIEADTVEKQAEQIVDEINKGTTIIEVSTSNEEEEKLKNLTEEKLQKQNKAPTPEIEQGNNSKEEEKINESPEITVTENKENGTIDFSTTVTEKTDTGKEKTVTITMSAENTTFEQASEKLDEYKKELEEEQEKLKVNISEQDRIEHEFQY